MINTLERIWFTLPAFKTFSYERKSLGSVQILPLLPISLWSPSVYLNQQVCSFWHLAPHSIFFKSIWWSPTDSIKIFMRGHKIHLCLKSPDIPDSPTSTSLTFQFNSLWFYLISSYQLLGMPVSLPSNLHTSEMSVCPFSQLFCYWFFLVFHSFWLLYYSNLFICSFNFLALFFEHFLYLLCLCLHSFSEVQVSINIYYQSVFIIITLGLSQVACIAPFLLVVPLGFYLALSLGIYICLPSHFVWFSLFIVSFPQAAGMYLLLFSMSAPWRMSMVQGLMQASWWEEFVPAPWWVEWGFVSLMCRTVSSDVFRGEVVRGSGWL